MRIPEPAFSKETQKGKIWGRETRHRETGITLQANVPHCASTKIIQLESSFHASPGSLSVTFILLE